MSKNYKSNTLLKIAGILSITVGAMFVSATEMHAQQKKVPKTSIHEGTLLGAIQNLFRKEAIQDDERLITGKIESKGFSRLPYVRTEGSNFKTIANYSGEFIIRVPLDEKKLIIGAPGLEERAFNINQEESHYDIQLIAEGNENAFIPNQPRLFGMNINSRSFNGAQTTLTAQDIRIRNSVTLDEVLVGAVPGLTVSGLGNGVATNFKFTIRGKGTLMASSDPLLLLDGSPYSGALNTINPHDVQYLTVLRGASATAVYGSRAANGIILITTKRGGDVDYDE